MSAATCQASAGSTRLQWRYEPLAMDIVCSDALLESIRQQTVESFCRLAHGGLETGGILFGRRTGRSIEILQAVPIDCEHRLGPSFVLSPADEASLQKVLTGENLGTLRPLGLYMSHSRRGFVVAEADIRILDRYFPEPWQMALLLIPSKVGATRAGFFFRGVTGPTFVCGREMMLASPELRAKATAPPEEPAATPPAAATSFATTAAIPAALSPASPDPAAASMPHPAPLSSAEPALGPDPIAEITPQVTGPMAVEHAGGPLNTHGNALERLQAFLALAHSHWRVSQWNLAVTLSLFVLFVLAAALLLQSRSAQSALIAPLRVTNLGEQLRIDWDPANRAVREANEGLLQIQEGASEPVNIPIARTGLDTGSAFYVPQSGNIEVRLKLVPRQGAASEFVVYFVDPTRRAPAPAPVSLQATATIPLPAAPMRPLPQAQLEAPTPPQAQSQSQTQSEARPEERAARGAGRSSAPERAKVVKQFQVPMTSRLQAVEPRVSINLPEPPEIHQATSPTLPLVNASSIAALLTPPRSVGPPQLNSGHLIWTGDLRKNSVLSISPAGASFGVLNGRLPGVPVKINLLPAELVDEGIAIYTRDEKRAATRSAVKWNGWNIFFDEWDSKRVPDLAVMESPTPSNNWRRLVVRNNGRHNASVIVVDWERTSGR